MPKNTLQNFGSPDEQCHGPSIRPVLCLFLPVALPFSIASSRPFTRHLIMFNFLRSRAEHSRLSRRDSETHYSDTLLPSSSSSSLTLKAAVLKHSSRDVQVAVWTLVMCTIVYIGAAIWIAFNMGTSFVADADDFCIHHVSQYCKLVVTDMQSGF